MSKKKKKNSDYRYLQRQEDEKRTQREMAERKKDKAKKRGLYIVAILFLLASIIIWAVALSNKNETLGPIYTALSGLGMLLIGIYYRESRKTFSNVGIILGVVMLALAFYIARGMGWFGI